MIGSGCDEAPARRRAAALVLVWVAAALLPGCGDTRIEGAPAASAALSAPATKAAPSVQAFDQALRGVQQRPQQRALAAEGTPAFDAATLDAANQLLDFGEARFPQFFPAPQTTRWFDGYLYRHYPATGIFLAVRGGQVYVLGGPFGDSVQHVGAMAQFITPRPPAASGLCSQAGAVSASYATAGAVVGRNVGLAVASCNPGAIVSPRWRQLSGPAVALVADKSQAVSFNPEQPGEYRFALEYTDALGNTRSETLGVPVSAPVNASAPSALALRASHAVRMGSKVSLRAWPQLAAGDEVAEIVWSQIEGPAVTLDTRDSHQALFTAPQVPSDTLLRLRAVMRSKLGAVGSDEVAVLVERHEQAAANDRSAVWAGEHVARVYPYIANGPHAAVLRRCVYDSGQMFDGPGFNLCRLQTLPLLAQGASGNVPSVEQVMQRVLVSHDWLGRNFEALLREHDNGGDLRRMLGSVTAIVLSSHIRPSFYYAGTGAMYLDADSFWLTPEERDTINEAPDYRGEFDDGLKYKNLWRYVRDGRNLFVFADSRQRITRTLEQVRDDALPLLYHELAHALDYMPPDAWPNLNSQRTVWDNIWPRYSSTGLASDSVAALYPLRSQELAGLAQVKFRGARPDALQASYGPEQVAAFFAADVATDDYAYTDKREDLAMLVEETLMALRLGAARDVAFSDPFGREATSAAIVVRWGQRGRIGEAEIRPRAREALQRLLPWLDPGVVDQLPAPQMLRVGQSWRDNLAPLGTDRRALAAAPDAAAPAEPPWLHEQRWQQRRRGAGPALPPGAR